MHLIAVKRPELQTIEFPFMPSFLIFAVPTEALLRNFVK